MKTIIVIVIPILAVAICLSGCGLLNLSAEEEAVYRAVLEENYLSTSPVFVIYEYTKASPFNDDWLNQLHPFTNDKVSLAQETIDNFILRNATSQKLAPDMDLGSRYILITQDEKDEILQNPEERSELFQEKYPDSFGIITLSRVGFNKDQTQALVSYNFNFAFLFSAGAICVLEKESGTWIWKDCLSSWKSSSVDTRSMIRQGSDGR